MSILRVDYASPDAPADFTRSIKETGFGVLTNHPLDMSLVNELFQEWEAFFNMPKEEKMKYWYNNETQDGLFGTETAVGADVADIKEYFHFRDWGQCPDWLRPKTLELERQMEHLGSLLLTWIQDNTPNEVKEKLVMSFPDMIKGSKRHVLRILHYPPFKGDEQPGAIRAAAHADIDLLTVLPVSTAQGLQVQSAQGEWLDVPCDPGSIVFNVGDMMELASGGYFKSTIHRVCNPEGEAVSHSRMSMPLFLHAEDSVQLSPEYTAQEFLLKRLAENGVYIEEGQEA